MTPQQLIDRGREAQQMLESPLMQQALSDMRESIIKDWEALGEHEPDVHLRVSLKVIAQFKSQLRRYIADGNQTKRKEF